MRTVYFFAFLQFGVKALRTLIVLLLIARSTDVATTCNRHRTRSKRGVIIEKFQNYEYFSEQLCGCQGGEIGIPMIIPMCLDCVYFSVGVNVGVREKKLVFQYAQIE